MRKFITHFVLSTILLLTTQLLSAQIAFQGFEGSAGDSWSFTATPAKYNFPITADVWADTTGLSGPTTAATGVKAWLGRDLQNDFIPTLIWHNLDFAPISVSAFTNVVVSFKYAVTGYEPADSSRYSISYDNGSTWTLYTNLTSGGSTAGWETVTVNVPAGSSFVRLRLAAKQNGGDDWIQFDDIKVDGDGAADVVAPSVATATNNGTNQITVTFSEAVTAATATNTANYTGVAGLTTAVQTSPTVVTLTYAANFPNNVPNNLSVSGIVDLAGNAMIAPYAYMFTINSTVASLVFTEIMYNDPNSGTDSLEFVEIYNNGTSAVNMGGMVFSGLGIPAFTLPSVNVPAGGTFLLAPYATIAGAFYGQTFYDWGSVGLSNGGTSIMLRNSTGVTIDSVSYDDEGAWPTTPDGGGPSLVLANPNSENNSAANWAAATSINFPAVAGVVVIANPGSVVVNTAVTLTVNTLNVQVTEGAGTATFSIVPSAAPATAVTVDVVPAMGSTAIAGTDFSLAATSVTLPAGSTAPVVVTVTIIENTAVTGGKYVALDLANPVGATLGANKQMLLMISDNDLVAPAAPANPNIALTLLSSYDLGGVISAEIVTHDPATQRLFVANSVSNTLEILNAANPAALAPVSSIALASYGGLVNSVDFNNGVLAVAIENAVADQPGVVVFFDANGTFISQVTVGVLPDMVAFSPNGLKVLTANEGQPLLNYTSDPVGSVSIIDISGGVAGVTNANVTQAGFGAFESQIASLRASGVRIYGPSNTVSQDMEPEYLTFSADGTKAYATCQENNALAVVDLATNSITQILPLGTKDVSLVANTIDASDQSLAQFSATWPIKSMYLPDAIAQFTVAGISYLITANEGDARADYGTPNEEVRIASLSLDPTAYPNATLLKNNRLLGRLRATNATGDTDADGDIDMIHAFGGRSFSVWNATTGALVYDSGDDLEMITSTLAPWNAIFNASGENNTPRTRSDDKGPEPEGVTTAIIEGVPYAFITLERIGGVMVYDLSVPTAPVFVQYVNNRNTTVGGVAGPDIAPEGIIYVSAADSPNGKSLVIVANEVSGSLSVYEVGVNCDGIVGTDSLTTFFADVDADGFGDAANTTAACTAPDGFVAVAGDCQDSIATINPDALEICNEIDDNCNTIVDTDLDVCAAPTDLGVDSLGVNTATLSWIGDSCTTDYRIRYRTFSAGVAGPWVSKAAATNSFTLVGLNALTRYQFRVFANCDTLGSVFTVTTFVTLDTFYIDNDGDGFGDMVVFQDALVAGTSFKGGDCDDNNIAVYPGAPEVANNSIDDDCDGIVDDLCTYPQNFVVTNQSATSVVITWTPSPNVDSYQLQYGKLGSTTPFTTINTTVASVTISGLIANEIYNFQARTDCSNGGFTVFSGIQSFLFTVDTACGRVKIGSAVAVSPSSEKLNWNIEANATGYKVRYRDIESAGPFTIKSVATNTPNLTLTGLSPATTYIYQVLAVCAAPGTPWSAQGNFLTQNAGVQALVAAPSLAMPSVFPNPTSDYLFVSDMNAAWSQLRITDVQGRILVSISAEEAQKGILVENWVNGMYFVQFIGADGRTYTERFMKLNN